MFEISPAGIFVNGRKVAPVVRIYDRPVDLHPGWRVAFENGWVLSTIFLRHDEPLADTSTAEGAEIMAWNTQDDDRDDVHYVNAEEWWQAFYKVAALPSTESSVDLP